MFFFLVDILDSLHTMVRTQGQTLLSTYDHLSITVVCAQGLQTTHLSFYSLTKLVISMFNMFSELIKEPIVMRNKPNC